MTFRKDLIAEQFLQSIPRGLLAIRRRLFPAPNAPNHLEPLTIISEMLVKNRLGASVATLMRRARIVAGAIQTNA